MDIWKPAVSLGVPGLALAIFYMLFKNFGFRFEPVARKWVAPIIILFMVVVAVVVLYALNRWAPLQDSGGASSLKLIDTVKLMAGDWQFLPREAKCSPGSILQGAAVCGPYKQVEVLCDGCDVIRGYNTNLPLPQFPCGGRTKTIHIQDAPFELGPNDSLCIRYPVGTTNRIEVQVKLYN